MDHVNSQSDKSKDKSQQKEVPLSLGLATYRTWSECFGGLKGRGRRYEIRHFGGVRIEYGSVNDSEVVVEDKLAGLM